MKLHRIFLRFYLYLIFPVALRLMVLRAPAVYT
jgi:hypothetical protein